jgi:hypothetical protein
MSSRAIILAECESCRELDDDRSGRRGAYGVLSKDGSAMTATILAVAAAVALATGQGRPDHHGSQPDSHLPASLDRIRAALEKPPPVLSVAARPEERSTFRVEVRQPFWVLRPTGEEPFDPTWGLPSLGELLMGGIAKIHSAAVGYKRSRAERRARKEVDKALAALCAVRECPTPDTR